MFRLALVLQVAAIIAFVALYVPVRSSSRAYMGKYAGKKDAPFKVADCGITDVLMLASVSSPATKNTHTHIYTYTEVDTSCTGFLPNNAI